MKKNFYIAFCATLLLGVAGGSPYTHAYDYGDFKGLNIAQKNELRAYQEYEHREPCQNYRQPPLGLVRNGCDLMRPAPFAGNEATVRDSTILSSYEVNFAFDKSAIEAEAELVLDRVAREIRAYHPSEVTISGFADRAGSSEYNVSLSKRRAQAVSQALVERGVPNRVTSELAYGEDRPAVETRDGVRLRENRRVLIEFRK